MPRVLSYPVKTIKDNEGNPSAVYIVDGKYHDKALSDLAGELVPLRFPEVENPFSGSNRHPRNRHRGY